MNSFLCDRNNCYSMGLKSRQCGKYNKKMIRTEGQLNLVICGTAQRVTATILGLKHLPSINKANNSLGFVYLKLSMAPDFDYRLRYKTSLRKIDCGSASIHETFTFDLSHNFGRKRLLISAWWKINEDDSSYFIGCLSFNLQNLIGFQQILHGWFYFLRESLGRKSYVKVSNHESKQEEIWEREELRRSKRLQKRPYSLADISSSSNDEDFNLAFMKYPHKNRTPSYKSRRRNKRRRITSGCSKNSNQNLQAFVSVIQTEVPSIPKSDLAIAPSQGSLVLEEKQTQEKAIDHKLSNDETVNELSNLLINTTKPYTPAKLFHNIAAKCSKTFSNESCKNKKKLTQPRSKSLSNILVHRPDHSTGESFAMQRITKHKRSCSDVALNLNNAFSTVDFSCSDNDVTCTKNEKLKQDEDQVYRKKSVVDKLVAIFKDDKIGEKTCDVIDKHQISQCISGSNFDSEHEKEENKMSETEEGFQSKPLEFNKICCQPSTSIAGSENSTKPEEKRIKKLLKRRNSLKFWTTTERKQTLPIPSDHAPARKLSLDQSKNVSETAGHEKTKRRSGLWKWIKESPQTMCGELNFSKITKLNEVLQHKEGVNTFRDFLVREHNEENLDFWIQCEEFKTVRESKLHKMAIAIYNKYVDTTSSHQVNLTMELQKDLKLKLAKPTSDMFEEAQRSVFSIMRDDPFRRFIAHTSQSL